MIPARRATNREILAFLIREAAAQDERIARALRMIDELARELDCLRAQVATRQLLLGAPPMVPADRVPA